MPRLWEHLPDCKVGASFHALNGALIAVLTYFALPPLHLCRRRRHRLPTGSSPLRLTALAPAHHAKKALILMEEAVLYFVTGLAVPLVHQHHNYL